MRPIGTEHCTTELTRTNYPPLQMLSQDYHQITLQDTPVEPSDLKVAASLHGDKASLTVATLRLLKQ